jgi:hypothetical protein
LSTKETADVLIVAADEARRLQKNCDLYLNDVVMCRFHESIALTLKENHQRTLAAARKLEDARYRMLKSGA